MANIRRLNSDKSFYRFLDDSFFDGYGVRAAMKSSLSGWTPHEIWNDSTLPFSRYVRHCGRKTEILIRQLMEECRPAGMFCSCGEPLLNFYNFCPICGKDAFEKGEKYHG